jgi:hypothetical protein
MIARAGRKAQSFLPAPPNTCNPLCGPAKSKSAQPVRSKTRLFLKSLMAEVASVLLNFLGPGLEEEAGHLSLLVYYHASFRPVLTS